MPVKELPISDFCKTGSGGTPSRSKSEYYAGGTIPWVKSGELHTPLITDTEEHITEAGLAGSSAKLVPAGAILLAMYGATVGKVSQLGVSATTNQAICNIIPDEDLCDKRYLIRCLESKYDEFISKSVGGGQPNISQQIIKETKIPLPSLPEQRRIAAILDKAAELRQKRRQAIEKLDQLLQSVFLDMFGDPVTNPKGWPTGELSALSDPSDRINYGVVQPGDHVDSGVPIIRVGDIDGGELSGPPEKSIAHEIDANYKRSKLRGTEILVSCVGSIGTVAVVPSFAINFNIARAITRVPLKNPASAEFVKTMIGCSGVQNYFKKKTRTVSQPTLNVEFVKSAPIIFPDETLIVQFCDIASRLKAQRAAFDASVQKQDAFFQSLQQRAFNGTL